MKETYYRAAPSNNWWDESEFNSMKKMKKYLLRHRRKYRRKKEYSRIWNLYKKDGGMWIRFNEVDLEHERDLEWLSQQ